jgi:outer membrane protein assembly factor BamB
LQDDVLYVGNIAGKVTAVSAADGSIVWQKDAGSPIVGGGALLPEAVAFATEGGSLIAWSLEDGQQLWTQTVGGKLYGTPVVAGENVVVPVSEGDKLLQAYNVNGQVSWPFALPE